MKIRLDFVTNSSSSCYVVGVLSTITSKKEFIQGMIEHLDLGPSWDKRLASYVGVTKVENIMNINMDSGTILSRLEEHDYLEFSVDERQNLNPHADIYYAELCTGGDCEQTYCEMISDGMRALGQVVLETYSYDC